MRGYLLLGLGALAWLAAGLYYGLDLLDLLGMALIAAGFLGAATLARGGDTSRLAIAGSLGLPVLGMILFLGPGLGSFGGLADLAGHLFLGGVAVATASYLVADAPRHRTLLRSGAGIAAAGSLLWVISDLDGGLAWEPGNLLGLAGAAWIALAPPPSS